MGEGMKIPWHVLQPDSILPAQVTYHRQAMPEQLMVLEMFKGTLETIHKHIRTPHEFMYTCHVPQRRLDIHLQRCMACEAERDFWWVAGCTGSAYTDPEQVEKKGRPLELHRLFSFDDVCHYLSYDPDYWRDRVMKYVGAVAKRRKR